jgi:hypothetical protein
MKTLNKTLLKVEALDAYTLALFYEQEQPRLVNMEPFLIKGKLAELKDLSLFKTVRVVYDTIEWANGADIDPESLYALSQPSNRAKFQT